MGGVHEFPGGQHLGVEIRPADQVGLGWFGAEKPPTAVGAIYRDRESAPTDIGGYTQ